MAANRFICFVECLGEQSAQIAGKQTPTVSEPARPESSVGAQGSNNPKVPTPEINAPAGESGSKGNKRPVPGAVGPPPQSAQVSNERSGDRSASHSVAPQTGSSVSFLKDPLSMSIARDENQLHVMPAELDSEPSGETLLSSSGEGSHHLDAPVVDPDYSGSDDEDITEGESDDSDASTTSGSRLRDLEARSIYYPDGTLRPRKAKRRAKKRMKKAQDLLDGTRIAADHHPDRRIREELGVHQAYRRRPSAGYVISTQQEVREQFMSDPQLNVSLFFSSRIWVAEKGGACN